ncbi:MAG TPA: hypothetical protein VLS88_03075 [Polyangiales bacterium]|nr:hypothetical protein [Polyangiales bacterium]
MLPGFIIEQIRQREEEAKRDFPQLELPLPMPEGSQAPEREEEPTRGVVIIDLLAD